MHIPVALDESNGGELFGICASSNMAVYAIEMMKLEVNSKLVTLQPESSQLFDEKEDLIMKYEVDQNFMNSSSFTVFHYYLRGVVDEAYYTTTNALSNAEIKTLQLHCIHCENDLFKPVKVKGDGSCLYRAIATHMMSCCLNDVWTGRFPPGKKPRIKAATYKVMNNLKQFISHKDNAILEKIFRFYAT